MYNMLLVFITFLLAFTQGCKQQDKDQKRHFSAVNNTNSLSIAQNSLVSGLSQSSQKSQCTIGLPYCENGKEKTGWIEDQFENSSTDFNLCMRRARDYWSWCQNTVSQPVYAKFSDELGNIKSETSYPLIEPAVHPAGNPGFKKSSIYNVTVFDGENWKSSYVWQDSRTSTTGWFKGYAPIVSGTKMMTSMTSTITINIAVTWKKPENFQIYPRHALQSATLNNSEGVLTITLKKAASESKNFVVTFDHDTFHPLVLSVIPRKPVVMPNDPDVLYFPSGVSYTCSSEGKSQPESCQWSYPVPANKTKVFFENGAFVRGTLNLSNFANEGKEVEIFGPGVLLADQVSWEYVEKLQYDQNNLPTKFNDILPFSMIHSLHKSGDSYAYTNLGNTKLFIKDITLLRQPFLGIDLLGENQITVDGITMVSPFTYNTSGPFIRAAEMEIKNNLLFIDDDMVVVEDSFYGNLKTSNNLMIGRSPYMLGYGYYPSHSNQFSGSTNGKSDHVVTTILPTFLGLFRAQMCGHDSTVRSENADFGPITIDGEVDRLIQLTFENTSWCLNGDAYGQIKNMTFKDITLNGNQRQPSQLIGISRPENNYSNNSSIQNIRFENLKINGVSVNSSNWKSYFEVAGPVKDIYFDGINVCPNWGC